MAPSMAAELQTGADAPKITLRQQLLAHGIAEGLSVSDAGEAAGYPSRQNAHDAYRRLRDKIPELLDGEGMGIRATLQRLKAKMDATKLEIVTFRGKVTDMVEVDDNPTQMKAIETVLMLMGLNGRDTSGPSIGTVNITWHGAAPAWAAPPPPATLDATVLPSSTVESTANSSDEGITTGISTLEGTGNGPAPYTHVHSGTLGERCSRDQRSTDGVGSSTPKKKRKPRLPVYRGESK